MMGLVLIGVVLFAQAALGQVAASFEASLPGPMLSPGPDAEGWFAGAGTKTIVPFGPITGPAFGFPTDNGQWTIVSSAGAGGYISPPAPGVPPPLPLPPGSSSRIRYPIALPASGALTIQFDWNYVTLECANPAFNDFFSVDLTDASGARLVNLLYRDQMASGYVSGAVTPNHTGSIPTSPCMREVAPVGQPKTATVMVPPQLGGQMVYFEVNVGDVNDVSFSGYCWLDNVRLMGGGLGTLSLSLSQPAGAGSFRLVDSNTAPGVETFHAVSLEPAPGGVGSGPYLGLWTVNVNNLLAQVASPLGTAPFHVLPSSPTYVFSLPAGIPSGLPLEMVAFELTGTALGRVSAVAAMTTQ